MSETYSKTLTVGKEGYDAAVKAGRKWLREHPDADDVQVHWMDSDSRDNHVVVARWA